MSLDLWELAAREQVRHAVHSYAIAGDSGRIERLAAQFTTDGILEIRGGDSAQGRDGIVAMLRRHTEVGAPPAGSAPFYVRHFITNVTIELLTPDDCRSVAYFAVFTPDGPDHWGRYRDLLVPQGDRWLLAHRTVRVDSATPGGWYDRVHGVPTECSREGSELA